MRTCLAALALFALALPAHGNVTRTKVIPEDVIVLGFRGAALTASLNLGGRSLPASRGATITAIDMHVYTGGGGGAGTTVVRVTDGTNNCDATFACATTNAAGVPRVAPSGTCSFAAGAQLRMSVTATGCTSTQPSVTTISALGAWN